MSQGNHRCLREQTFSFRILEEKGGAELTSCAILLSPVISVFISCFFLDESVTLSMLAGMLFIISGLFIAFRKEKSSGR